MMSNFGEIGIFSKVCPTMNIPCCLYEIYETPLEQMLDRGDLSIFGDPTFWGALYERGKLHPNTWKLISNTPFTTKKMSLTIHINFLIDSMEVF